MLYNKAGFAVKKMGRRIRQIKFKGRCGGCGQSIGKHDKFCMWCGAKQEKAHLMQPVTLIPTFSPIDSTGA